MNTNPHAKRIMCFGDSNTHGTIPYTDGDRSQEYRYDSVTRRPCVLQNLLGSDYEIVEEGRGGRTICMIGPDGDETKKGDLFLRGLVKSHRPLDMCVVMLGTNDVKDKFELTAQQIADNMDVYILSYLIQMHIPVVLISPPPIVEGILSNFGPGINAKITELNHIYTKLATSYDTVSYIDLQSQLTVGADGVHLTAQSHALIAEAVATYTSKFFTT